MAQRCPNCYSTAFLSIPERGDGKCRHCRGIGTLHEMHTTFTGHRDKCSYCSGSGQCQTCGGTGRVKGGEAQKQTATELGTKDAGAKDPGDEIERQWYRFCDASSFIPSETAREYFQRLKAARANPAAYIIGLHEFCEFTCPKCGQEGHFKVRFLGRLEHASCGWVGYMGTVSYVGYQVSHIFHTGLRAGASLKEDADRKGDKSGGWMNGIFGFFFVGILRAALAAVLIPLHTIAALCQTGQSRSDIVKRAIALGIALTAFGVGIFEIHETSKPPVPLSPPLGATQAPPTQFARISNSAGAYQPPVMPSFDCAKAHTKVELLICRDSRLAALEVEMASTYNQILSRFPENARLALRREHLAWFKNYSRTCNRSNNEIDRAACIANYLAARTSQLKSEQQ